MSKLKSAGWVSVMALLVYFAAPTSHPWPGGIQPAAAMEFDKKGKEPTKTQPNTMGWDNPQTKSNKPPAPAEKPKSKW